MSLRPIPNAERAVVDPAKLREYLLSATHPVGRLKAAFFRSLGYEARRWRRLEKDLRDQHLSQLGRELPVWIVLAGGVPSVRYGVPRIGS